MEESVLDIYAFDNESGHVVDYRVSQTIIEDDNNFILSLPGLTEVEKNAFDTRLEREFALPV